MVQLIGSSMTMHDVEPQVSESMEDYDPLQDSPGGLVEDNRKLRYNRNLQGNVLAAFNKHN